jgi:hypothetical protein
MMDDIPDEPKSDLDKWKPYEWKKVSTDYQPLVRSLLELRAGLIAIQVANNQRMLDRIDNSVLQSECSEANEVINYIMRK